MANLNSIHTNIKNIETLVDNLMSKLDIQETEINILLAQNSELKTNYQQTINEIAIYVQELENLKKIILSLENNKDNI